MSQLSVAVATNVATSESTIASANTDYPTPGGETGAHSVYVPLGTADYARLVRDTNSTPADIITAHQVTAVVNASSSSCSEPVSINEGGTSYNFSVIADKLLNENCHVIDRAKGSIDNNLQPLSNGYDNTYNIKIIEHNAEKSRISTGEYLSAVRATIIIMINEAHATFFYT
jgi:predicted nucleic acid-binding protein